ncbi:response regulator [Patescibacteria group bacterium]|nr:response regulator [Patescibacteria group bacterium]
MTEQSTKNKTILVIEDDAPTLQALVDTFTSEGFHVLKAKDGKKGLELALKEHPDLVLLDIIMPKMDGMTMLKKLREDEWGKDVQVVILTNLSSVEKTAEALKGRVYDYFVKTNWKLEDLVKRVKERLGVR